MKRSFPLVTTKQYLVEREKWLTEIRRGENVSVMFFPKTDRFRRLHQLIEDKQFLKRFLGEKATYLFQMTDFNVSLVEDKFDIYEHVARQFNLTNLTATPQTFQQWIAYFHQQNIRLVLILPDAEKYLTPENKHILPLLFEVVLDHAPTITVFSFYEVDITCPYYLSTISVLKDLFENIFSYPLYSSEDVFTFVRYLQKKWDMKINPNKEEKVVVSCGGHFWLVKEAVRELLNSGKWSYEEESMRFRLGTIYSSLCASEKSAIEKLITAKKSFTGEEDHSLAYLRKMNFLDRDNNFQIGLFQKYVQTHLQSSIVLGLENSVLTLNHVPLDKFLSRKEYRVLKLLFEHKGEVVSRDAIALRIWPAKTEEHYSDWAIDQLIARLRKRLVELALPSKFIGVVRGRGYHLTLLR